MKINYISTFHISSSKERQEELEATLFNNIANPIFNALHYFVDDETALRKLQSLIKSQQNAQKVKIAAIKRAKYSDLFEYAFKFLSRELCVITNSDIYFHAIPENLIRHLANHPKCIYALTRHEHDFSKPLINDYCHSHDAFMFMSPLDKKFSSKVSHFQFLLGAENIVVYELLQFGYKLYNPCLDIIIVHLHATNFRPNDRFSINLKRSRSILPSTIPSTVGYGYYKYELRNIFQAIRHKLRKPLILRIRRRLRIRHRLEKVSATLISFFDGVTGRGV